MDKGNNPQIVGGYSNNINKEANNIADEIIDFDIDIKDNDEEDLSFEDNEDDLFDEEGNRISNKHIFKTTLKYRTQDEMEFDDEVDTPYDVPARERFKKYKGLASMKLGTWDPNENLPKEYSNIYSFENLKNTQRLAIKKAHEEGMKISGNYVKISIKGFAKEDLNYMRNDTPLIMSSLLEHERKLCVMHYKISLNYEGTTKIKAKQTFEIQCGYRRLLSKPIFSSEISGAGVNSDKFKSEKYLEKDKFYYASVYSQMSYPNSPVLLFDNELDMGKNMVASGDVLNTNAKKLILKRIILTGYPVKIKKKKAVVRYMFFNPNDVNYFKPIQLGTKNGLRGHITESLGTHGHMKCIFNDYIKASDTVCLYLYKRVFPKWFKESWKYKVYYGNKNGFNTYFEKQEEEADTIIKKENINNKMIDY